MKRKSKSDEISEREFSCFVEAAEYHLGFLSATFGFTKEYSRYAQEYEAKYTKSSVTIFFCGERGGLGGVGFQIRDEKSQKIRSRSLRGLLGLRVPAQARLLGKMILAEYESGDSSKRLLFEVSCLRDFCPDLLHGRGDLIDCDSFAEVVDSMKDE